MLRLLSNPFLWLMLAIALFFVGSGTIGFVGPDEPRYADVARGMLRSGDYVTPRLFGSPWFEKPPLYYWLAALFFRVGITELNARLPSAVAACAFMGVWFWFARRLFGTRAAALSSMLLASTVGWIGFAHAAVMDMLLSTALDAAIVCLALWFWEMDGHYLYIFYALLGLATLDKGPVAVLLAGLIAIAYIITFSEWKAVKGILFTPALAAFVIVAVPWYALCYARNGYAFFQDFFLKHNIGRFTTAAVPGIGHDQPFWYYFPILAAGLFPWTPLLLLPLIDFFRSGPRALLQDRHKAFLLYWTIIPFIFFSLAKNKLPGYLLPILPPLSLWIALIAEGEESAEAIPTGKKDKAEIPPVALPEPEAAAALPRLALWLVGIAALLLLIVPVIASLIGTVLASGLRHGLAGWNLASIWQQLSKGPVPPVATLFLLLPIGLCFYMLYRRSLLEAAFLVMIGVTLCMLGIVQYVAPSINRAASVKIVAQRMLSMGVLGDQVGIYHLSRNQALGLSFYLDRALPEWSPPGKPESVTYVVSSDDERVPEAQTRIFFPAQHLSIWVLPASKYEFRIEPPVRHFP